MRYVYIELVVCRNCAKVFKGGFDQRYSQEILSTVQCIECFKRDSIEIECVIEQPWGKTWGDLRFLPTTGINGVINFTLYQFFDGMRDLKNEYEAILERTGEVVRDGTLEERKIQDGDRLILRKVA